MKTKILVFLIFFGLSLGSVNLLLWHLDKEESPTTLPLNKNTTTQSNTENAEPNFSVEKLNNQTSVKQLRKALFSEPELDSSEYAEKITESELTYELERLSQELLLLSDELK
jgi:hypothetical protein